MSEFVNFLLPWLFKVLLPILLLLLSYIFVIKPLKIRNILCKFLVIIFCVIASFKNFICIYFGKNMFSPEFPGWVTILLSVFQVCLIFLIFFGLLRVIIFYIIKIFSENFAYKVSSIFSYALVVFSIILSAIGCLNASSNPELHFYKLYSDKLPNYYNKQLNSNGFRIVHLSDIHIANNISKDKVEKLVAQVNSLNPDVVLITGDIIDGCYELIKEQVGELAKLHSKYGVYGITGNHEYYSDFENWKEKFSQININLLENDSVTLWDGHRQIINIAGVNDNQALKVKGKNFEGTDFQKALKNVVNTVPTVVMVHKPAEFINVMNYDVFLTLSGHTHGGMVPILKNLVKVFNKGFVSGFYEEKNHKLIVSNGTFLWSGFYSRINTPGEIIIIDIFKK